MNYEVVDIIQNMRKRSTQWNKEFRSQLCRTKKDETKEKEGKSHTALMGSRLATSSQQGIADERVVP